MERDLVLKIGLTLEPLLGAEKFRAGASVDVDFTSADQSDETLRSLPLGHGHVAEDRGYHRRRLQAGVPGTASNLPRPPAAARRIGDGNHANNRKCFLPDQPDGEADSHSARGVKRMSLAVLVDQNVRWEGMGPKAKRILEAPSPEKLKTIRDLVAAATWFLGNSGRPAHGGNAAV